MGRTSGAVRVLTHRGLKSLQERLTAAARTRGVTLWAARRFPGVTDSDPGATFPTDGVRLEAVVDGRVAPEDLTPQRAALLDLADAARGPASTKEIAGLGDALIVFAAQHRDEAEPGCHLEPLAPHPRPDALRRCRRCRRRRAQRRGRSGRNRPATCRRRCSTSRTTRWVPPSPGGTHPRGRRRLTRPGITPPDPRARRQPSASTASSGDTSPVSAVPPSSSPRSSGQGQPAVGLGAAAAAHHHHHVAPKHPSAAHPKGSAHSQQKTHTHHKKHHQWRKRQQRQAHPQAQSVWVQEPSSLTTFGHPLGRTNRREIT